MTRSAQYDEKFMERFWSKVVVAGDDDCWEWTGGKQKGYGCIRKSNSRIMLRAHRISWEVSNGRPVPKGLHVLHKCDNRKCVNPSHLLIGTHQDNVTDAVQKRRNTFGERAPQSRLTESDVTSIRRMASEGLRQVKIAKAFCVSKDAVSSVITRKSWKHLPGGEYRRGKPSGERHYAAKLTNEKADQIRNLVSSGETQVSVARKFNISFSVVSAVVRGVAWTEKV